MAFSHTFWRTTKKAAAAKKKYLLAILRVVEPIMIIIGEEIETVFPFSL